MAFVAGAVTDAAALIPMLSRPMAELMWGISDPSGGYFFAMGYGASLMAGWTLLLLWACGKPLERSFVALLTLLVILGLATTDVIVVISGGLKPIRMVPTWTLQAVLAGLFGYAYFQPRGKYLL